jgi:hypothetical protein
MNKFRTVVLFVFVTTDIFHFSNPPSSPYLPEEIIAWQPDSLNAKFHINSSLMEMNLKGRVRKLTETEYDGIEVSGKIQRGAVGQKKISYFDTSGYMTRIRYYPQSNTKSQMQTMFNYDNKLRLSEECLYVELAGKSVLWRKINLKYDAKGKKIEREEFIHFEKDSLVQDSKANFSYDSSDLKCEGICYSAKNDIHGNTIDTSKDSYTLDFKGNVIEKNSVDNIGKATRSVYKYDEESNLIEIHHYNPVGKPLTTKPEKADKNMNEFRPRPNEEISRIKYLKFDKSGNWILSLKSEYLINTYTQREIDYY